MNFLRLISTLYLCLLSTNGQLITLPDGTQLQGKKSGRVAEFKGIPYASPPVGNLRWAPPVPYTNPDPSQVIDATEFGSVCKQLKFGGGSEDCLFLNVFVDEDRLTNSSSKDLSVAFFIHGGAYHDGCSNIYDGAQLVEYWGGDAIVVTINYRLSSFGFLGSEELRKQDSESGSTGNYGIQDQRLAMQWVQENIAVFGGDKNRVMIFGESAGAGSVTNHLTMKKSWDGLFQAAVLESGAFAEWNVQNMTLSQNAYDSLLAALNCADLECMLSKSTEDIFKASEQIPSEDVNYLYPFNPTVDGVEATTHPWIAMTNGDVIDVPLIFGTNEDEGSMFTLLPKGATEEQLIAHWTREGYTAEEQAIMLDLYVKDVEYPEVEGDTVYWWAGQRSLGDASMSCPAKYAAQTLSSTTNRQSDLYVYHFEHKTADWDYVPHTAEIDYVFHNFILLKETGDRDVSDVMSSYWGNFAVGDAHDPNSPTVGLDYVPKWPSYDSATDEVLIIGDTVYDIAPKSGLKLKECAFHIDFIDHSINSKY